MTKFANPFTPPFDLVVTRHRPLVEWLLREGHVADGTPVVEHAHADLHHARVVQAGSGYEVHAGTRLLGHETPLESQAVAFAADHNAANVRGKHVLGVLPHHLSALAKSITEVQLDWAIADRAAMQAGDLDVEAVARAARGLHTYRVTKHDASARPGVAFARAIIEAEVCGDGIGIKFLTNRGAAIIEVSDFHGYRDVQVDLYAGAIRFPVEGSTCEFGPWLDPLTDRPWQDSSRVRAGKTASVHLVGSYPTDLTQAKIDAG